MDTQGRPTLNLHAINVIDEWRDAFLVITYDYPWTAGYRKPVTFTIASLGFFATAFVLTSLNLRIGKGSK